MTSKNLLTKVAPNLLGRTRQEKIIQLTSHTATLCSSPSWVPLNSTVQWIFLLRCLSKTTALSFLAVSRLFYSISLLLSPYPFCFSLSSPYKPPNVAVVFRSGGVFELCSQFFIARLTQLLLFTSCALLYACAYIKSFTINVKTVNSKILLKYFHTLNDPGFWDTEWPCEDKLCHF